jgi:hypothetical protein
MGGVEMSAVRRNLGLESPGPGEGGKLGGGWLLGFRVMDTKALRVPQGQEKA